MIFKQVAFPATDITVNMFITVIFLTTYKKFEYGLFEQTDSLIKYNYCDMETYFYTDVPFVIILSMLCASFHGKKTISELQWNLLYLSCYVYNNKSNNIGYSPRLSFNTDGQKIFVNSLVNYSANMALISIAYGYKIHIMLFQKHRNTKKLSKK